MREVSVRAGTGIRSGEPGRCAREATRESFATRHHGWSQNHNQHIASAYPENERNQPLLSAVSENYTTWHELRCLPAVIDLETGTTGLLLRLLIPRDTTLGHVWPRGRRCRPFGKLISSRNGAATCISPGQRSSAVRIVMTISTTYGTPYALITYKGIVSALQRSGLKDTQQLTLSPQHY